MNKFEQQTRNKKHISGSNRNDARPRETSIENARHRTAILISGRLAGSESEHNVWEQAVNTQSLTKE